MIKLPSYFVGFGSKADGSAALRLATQELTPDDFALLKSHLGKFGWFVFKESEIQDEDIPSDDIEEDSISASERLRRIMFVFWKQKVNDGDFDAWRRKYLEKLIGKIKDTLD